MNSGERPHIFLVLMSGGVDSAVAAYLLKKQGHEVAGVTMKLFNAKAGKGGCCGSPGDACQAKECARLIGISHRMIDVSEVFKLGVIDAFAKTYLDGKTPNPCVECNRVIKFGRMLDLADAWGFDAVATGHYARISPCPLPSRERVGVRGSLKATKKFLSRSLGLFCAKDKEKDQSYFLYMLNEKQLQRILFPVGGLKKTEVRKIAAQAGLPVAQKPESQDICFADSPAAGGYRALFKKQAGVGPIVRHKDGKILGRHDGYFKFTIGQRCGLGIAAGKPIYVTGIDPETKMVIVGDNQDLMKNEIYVTDLSLVNRTDPLPKNVEVKIRYKSPPATAALEILPDGNSCRVKFYEPQRAPAPGQFAVFYDKERVLGGGKIL
ncbi:MAG: tRNA 2-thiouridine(34) synthase MnmA [Elusimicrobia bacterium]|nr:tRNA 2-thiouridine(34) synthase MnmA [Elusimicrobiota bacterium]